MIKEAEKRVGELKKEYNDLLLEKGKIIAKIKFLLQEETGVIQAFEKTESNNNAL